MDKKSTFVKMSLYDYEHIKECQSNHKDLINEIKSMVTPINIEDGSPEIIIDKEKLEKFLFNFASDCLNLKHLDFTHVVFHYK
ncbi:MAG: hypothetical protein ABFD18_11120 [Syntrophomonas sp.]